MAKDFYDILGVKENADASAIKSAFRTLAKKYHPDRNSGDKTAEARFKEISEAYETLSDSKKREQYDMMRKYGAFSGAGAQGGNPFGNGGFDFSQFANQGNGFASFSSGGVDLGGFEDIFGSIFGNQGFGRRMHTGQRRSAPQKGANITTSMTISFYEAINGSKRQIQLQDGKKLMVTIPAGIRDGGKIRLTGQGQQSRFRGQSGDLIITVRVMPDKDFERKGNDIHTTLDVSFKEAILGCKKNVKTLTKTVALTIPPGTQPGTVMRLKGLGLAVGGNSGDQYVKIQVTIPKDITEEQRKVLEDWE